MSPQRDGMITKQVPEQHIKDEDNLWTLGNPMKTSKTGSPSTSIATSMVIWQRNTNQRKRNEKHELALNATRRGTLPKIVKRNSR